MGEKKNHHPLGGRECVQQMLLSVTFNPHLLLT